MSKILLGSLSRALKNRLDHGVTFQTRCYATSFDWQAPLQSYISSSQDPYLNLSIEHHLLQTTPIDSVVLFLYVNRPSIIIGRNQNPWYEVNLALLNSAGTSQDIPHGLGNLDLVRRRSGGGTVFHDQGNVNWTVICPSGSFTRDKHAEMVVRALRSQGVDRARVNARHDIVLDQGEPVATCDPEDTHQTPYLDERGDGPRSLKISGSAYKLTRGRALHHGTCLLGSPNLALIPRYLHSPARPYITARGVESVSSPVANVQLSNADFVGAVQEHFARMYDDKRVLRPKTVDEDLLSEGQIRKGYKELKSLDWTYLQTPQFTISSSAVPDLDVGLNMSLRYGAFVDVTMTSAQGARPDLDQALKARLTGKRLHEVSSWEEVLRPTLSRLDDRSREALLSWLQQMLPPRPSEKS